MIDTLRNINLLKDLSEQQLSILSDFLSKHEYKANQIIFREGDTSDGLYIIENGEVKIYKKIPGGGQKTLAELYNYDFF